MDENIASNNISIKFELEEFDICKQNHPPEPNTAGLASAHCNPNQISEVKLAILFTIIFVQIISDTDVFILFLDVRNDFSVDPFQSLLQASVKTRLNILKTLA